MTNCSVIVKGTPIRHGRKKSETPNPKPQTPKNQIPKTKSHTPIMNFYPGLAVNLSMKRTLLLLIFLPALLLAQDALPSLKEFEASKSDINRTGMLVLGGWALANIISGTTLSLTMKGEAKYFNQFNALWNTVNLGLAINGLLNTGTDTLSLFNSVTGHQTLQNIFVLNAGLDLAYIATGFFL